jgi:hypothetical protein
MKGDFGWLTEGSANGLACMQDALISIHDLSIYMI